MPKLFQIAFGFAITVTAMYWLLLYSPGPYICNFECYGVSDCNSLRYPTLSKYSNVTCSLPKIVDPNGNPSGLCSVSLQYDGVIEKQKINDLSNTLNSGYGGLSCKNGGAAGELFCGMGASCVNRGNSLTWDNIAKHVLNSVFLVGEMGLNNTPLMRSHTFLIIFIGMVYSLVNFLYVHVTGDIIYGVLPWTSFGSVALAMGVLLVAIFVIILGCGIGKAKSVYEVRKARNHAGDHAKEPVVIEIH